MTEADWLAATDPRHILYAPGWQHRRPSDPKWLDTCDPRVTDERKLRLYACACFRLSFPELTYLVDRLALDAAERFADGIIPAGELAEVSQRCGLTASVMTHQPALSAARSAVGGHPVRPNHPAGPQQPLPNPVRCDLLRCIFGNPFRPVAFDPRWRTETAVALATGIYADRAFDRMPVLADALEEAGCDQVDVLAHCRGPGPHARGCWVVDGVLGKG